MHTYMRLWKLRDKALTLLGIYPVSTLELSNINTLRAPGGGVGAEHIPNALHILASLLNVLVQFPRGGRGVGYSHKSTVLLRLSI